MLQNDAPEADKNDTFAPPGLSGRGRLRILSFAHALNRGGAERAAVRLWRQWAQDADMVLAIGEGHDEGLAGAGVRVRRAPPRLAGLSPNARMLAWLPGVIRAERPDILFCPGNTYAIVAAAMRLLAGGACPPIVAKVSNPMGREDLPPPRRRAALWWARTQGRMIDRFVATSAAMADEIAAVAQVPASRIDTIPNPAFDAAVFARLTDAPGPAADAPGRLFVGVGRLVAQKNFALMVAAFARGAMPADRLVILGEGPERPMLEGLIAAAGLGDRVTLAGFNRDAGAWIGRADALILSSRYEGLPAVVLEAMAAGRPVIATDCCVAMAPLLAGGAGVLVPPGDAAAMAAAIATLDPAAFDPAHARAVAARHVTERVAQAYWPVFLAAIAAPGPRTQALVPG
ncbi:glycosyltransferase [Sphingomonas metalli]|uniref:glycosyltransferase n=1 Tax=Sphingomonas metalli TaxID=1779358 RepID=UPI00166F1A36|nr:glycosyltransferase [Sphingomonas metalli]